MVREGWRKTLETDMASEGKRPACNFLELFLSHLPILTVSPGLGLGKTLLCFSRTGKSHKAMLHFGDGCVQFVQRRETIKTRSVRMGRWTGRCVED